MGCSSPPRPLRTRTRHSHPTVLGDPFTGTLFAVLRSIGAFYLDSTIECAQCSFGIPPAGRRTRHDILDGEEC